MDKPAGLGAGGLFARDVRTRLATLVATALPPRNHATVVPFDCGRHHTTALSGADADATGSDADRVIIVPTIIVPVAVTAELNVYSWALAGVMTGAVVSTATAAAAMKAIFIMRASSFDAKIQQRRTKRHSTSAFLFCSNPRLTAGSIRPLHCRAGGAVKTKAHFSFRVDVWDEPPSTMMNSRRFIR